MSLNNDIIATAGLDTKDFQKSLDSLNRRGGDFITGLGSAFAGFSLAAISQQVLGFADDVQDASEKLDLSAESLQRFESAFGKAGASSEKFQRGFGIFLEKLDEAREGSSQAAKDFERVGILLADIKSQSPETLFYKFADSIKNSADNAEMLNKSVTILGKSGRDLKTGLSQGGEGLREAMAKAVVATDEEIARLGELNDKLVEIKRSAMAITAQATGIDYIGLLTGDANAQQAQSMAGQSFDARRYKEARMKTLEARKKAFQEEAKENAKIQEKARQDALNDDWGATAQNPRDAAMSAGVNSIGNDLDSKHEAYVDDWEKSYNDMIDAEKEAKDQQIEKDKKAYEESCDKLVDAGAKIQKKIEDAADSLASKANDFQKTGSERRAERQAERDQERAERTVKAREKDESDRVARGSFRSEEERAAAEAEKRKGFFGEEGKKNLGKQPVSATQEAKTLTSIDDNIKELLKLYGKTTK